MFYSITFLKYNKDDDWHIELLNDSNGTNPEHDRFIIKNAVNTWGAWRIIPASRPVFSPPSPKITTIDIPGANGLLDLSEALTGYPVYDNREGSFEFYVMNDDMEVGLKNDGYEYKSWAERYSDIMDYLHGREFRVILEDDPEYFYQGRISVSDWKSEKSYSKITVKYSVGPYKWKLLDSSDGRWLWDPFNFETGIAWDGACTDVPITKNDNMIVLGGDNIPESISPFGRAPISPTIYVEGSTDTQTKVQREVRVTLKDGRDTILSGPITLREGYNFVPDFIFYGSGEYKLEFSGNAIETGKGITVSIKFRSGRL